MYITTVPAPKKVGEDQAIGRSRGGLRTKIHTMADALSNPQGFHLTGSEAHDLVGADHLMSDMQADALIAYKAFGKAAVIPPKANCRTPCKPGIGRARRRGFPPFELRNTLPVFSQRQPS